MTESEKARAYDALVAGLWALCDQIFECAQDTMNTPLKGSRRMHDIGGQLMSLLPPRPPKIVEGLTMQEALSRISDPVHDTPAKRIGPMCGAWCDNNCKRWIEVNSGLQMFWTDTGEPVVMETWMQLVGWRAEVTP